MTNLIVAAAGVRAAPDADQDVERDQHRLEEDVEEQQVLGGEDADRRADEDEHEPEVGPGALAAGPQPVRDRQRADADGQADEPEREVVEADLVRDAEVLEPDRGRLVLEPRRSVVEARRRPRSRGRARRARRRARTGPGCAPGQEPEEQAADDGDEDQPGRQHLPSYRTRMKTRTMTAAPARSRMA